MQKFCLFPCRYHKEIQKNGRKKPRERRNKRRRTERRKRKEKGANFWLPTISFKEVLTSSILVSQ